MAEKFQLEATQGYLTINADNSIKNIIDASIEVITNSSDSYWSMPQKYGKIEIAYSQKRRSIIYKDWAAGMSYDHLKKAMMKMGDFSAERHSRGMNSRGLKDIRVIGSVTVRTIKDGIYSECHLDEKGDGTHESRSVSAEDRKILGIPADGTVVTLINSATKKSKYNFVKFENFSKSLKKHHSLYGLVKESVVNEKANITLVDYDTKKKEILKIKDPSESKRDGEIFEIDYQVEGYEKYTAKFTLIKLNERTDRKIIVSSNPISIHQQNFLEPSLLNNHHLEYYYGFLECKGIDELAREYVKNPGNVDEKNPNSCVDSNRQSGLITSHPFVKSLLSMPINKLKEIIREADEKDRNEITEDVSDEVKKTNKAMQKILSEMLEDPDSTSSDGMAENVRKMGYMIWPPTAKILTNDEKSFVIWIHQDNFSNKEKPTLKINLDTLEKCLEISPLILRRHSNVKFTDIFCGEFSIKTFSEEANGIIVFREEKSPIAKLKTDIFEKEIRAFKKDIEFENDNYTIYGNKSKKIKIFARYPEFVQESMPLSINLENDNVKLTSNRIYTLKAKKRSNFASAEIEIVGIHTGHSTKISVEAGNLTDKAIINVKEEKVKKSGPEIVYVDDPLGGYRYQWTSEKDKLEISKKNQMYKKTVNTKAFDTYNLNVILDAYAELILTKRAEQHPADYEYFSGDIARAVVQFQSDIRRLKRDMELKLAKFLLKS